MSSALVAYGFARFKFFGHNILFAAMLSYHDASGSGAYDTPVSVVPEIRLGRNLSSVDCTLLLCNTGILRIYDIQFYRREFQKELDEAAKIDGCSYWGIFVNIMLPLIKPALVDVLYFLIHLALG